jgi:hypothetical protein
MAFCKVKFRRVLGKIETNQETFQATVLFPELYSNMIQVVLNWQESTCWSLWVNCSLYMR